MKLQKIALIKVFFKVLGAVKELLCNVGRNVKIKLIDMVNATFDSLMIFFRKIRTFFDIEN